MEKILYFAYGSNMCYDRIVARLGAVKNVGTHTLHGYKLIFNAKSLTDVYANIVPCEDSFVEGVLYEFNNELFKLLDRYELLYHREFFKLQDGTLVCTYVADTPYYLKKDKKPSLSYLNTILEGCAKNKLDYTFNMLQEYKKKNYKLKSLKTFI